MFRDSLYTSIISAARSSSPHHVGRISYSVGRLKIQRQGALDRGRESKVPEKWSKMQEYLQGALSSTNLAGLLL